VFCANCGRELLGTQLVCPYCGASIMGSSGVGKAETAGGTCMPLTAGILDIIVGAIGVIFGIVVATLGTLAGGLVAVLGLPAIGWIVAGAAAIPLAVGTVAIIGGIYASKRRIWGLALAGSICSLIVWFLGIPAIVFTALGKSHFE
jgi:hypothetical protein